MFNDRKPCADNSHLAIASPLHRAMQRARYLGKRDHSQFEQHSENQLMAGGGARPGAGRKPGVVNRFNELARAKAAEGGITPLEYMLSVLRDEDNEMAMRMDAAKSAAPYLHAKLTSVEHKGGLDVTTQTKEQRDAAVAAAALANS